MRSDDFERIVRRAMLGRLTDPIAERRSHAARRHAQHRDDLTFSPGERLWIAFAFWLWCAAIPALLR